MRHIVREPFVWKMMPGRVRGGAAGLEQRALVEHQDVGHAQLGEVIRGGRADDAGADDHGLGAITHGVTLGWCRIGVALSTIGVARTATADPRRASARTAGGRRPAAPGPLCRSDCRCDAGGTQGCHMSWLASIHVCAASSRSSPFLDASATTFCSSSVHSKFDRNANAAASFVCSSELNALYRSSSA